ncbi:hypothetical protein TSTA_106530 [Talaromyces stipitatus ATCC 10500]|uniref:C6 finger domain protein n=1 Tax=Talaromyces stipitatus (strain ATCC 10500 / CBS 375.48 / QM 6759 / NRRL 1006) TaxID=441959 RepID=B8MPK4_TALSN|nr:uncharacterized protein TSTA_106530 [Talaromyces stipitatus ATCC 10500]EED14443.1 hypothetical protein TSTA_106530 [Talaromyces stipitatus ATCC 10500]
MQGADGNYCPLKDLWWNMGLFDRTAFLVILGLASRVLNLLTCSESKEHPEATTYYTKSVRALQRRIENAEDRLSEGVIVTVLEFAYYDNLSRWLIHMNGVSAIIHDRGGTETLKSSYIHIRIDVSGSFIFDRKPFFPAPCHLLHELEYVEQPGAVLFKLNSRFPDLSGVIHFLSETTNLMSFIDGHANESKGFEDDRFLSRTFNGYVHKLLSLPRTSQTSEIEKCPKIIVREAVRRACITLFALLRENFSIKPSGVYEHRNLLKELLLQYEIDWTPYLELRLWVLAVAALAADNVEVHWYMDEICGTATQMGLLEWDEVRRVLRHILWSDQMFKYQEGKIREMFEMADQ